MSEKLIIQKLDSIEKMLTEQILLKKEILDFNETAIYLNVSHSFLYKLTSAGKIPFHKPSGKKLYFSRKEIDGWLLFSKHNSHDEIESEATDYLLKKGRVR